MSKKTSLYLNKIFFILDLLLAVCLIKVAAAPNGTTSDIILAGLTLTMMIMNGIDIFLYYAVWRHRK